MAGERWREREGKKCNLFRLPGAEMGLSLIDAPPLPALCPNSPLEDSSNSELIEIDLGLECHQFVIRLRKV